MNITVDHKVLEQALETLQEATTYTGTETWSPSMTRDCERAITALRAALGQQYMTNAVGELEPVTIVQTGVGVGKPKQKESMKRPVESDYTSHVAYTRALEEYCDALEQLGASSDTSQERVDETAEQRHDIAPPQLKPEQEPVAWRVRRNDGQYELYFVKASAERAAECYIKRPQVEPLYTAPPQRKPLTDDLIYSICKAQGYSNGFSRFVGIVRAIETAHGITGKA